MFDLLLSSGNFIFSFCLFFIGLFLILELFLLFVGLSISQFHIHLEIVDDLMYSFFGKKVPILITFLLFLFIFGISGTLINFYFSFIFVNQYIMAIVLVLPSLYIVNLFSTPLSKLLKEETSAISIYGFVGSVGVVVLGIAKPGSPAEVKVLDCNNKEHYFMVESKEGEILAGEQVLLLEVNKNHIFLGEKVSFSSKELK